MNRIRIAATIAVMIAQPIIAQQATTSPQTQPASAASTPYPCKPNPSQPRKVGWLEKKARDLACKKNANACNLPGSIDEAMGTTQTATPCTSAPAAKTATPTAAPAPPAPAPNAKTVYVCPPKTTLIANTPYCLAADRTTVDAIPLPPNQQQPAVLPR